MATAKSVFHALRRTWLSLLTVNLVLLLLLTLMCGLIALLAGSRGPFSVLNLARIRYASTRRAFTTWPEQMGWRRCLKLTVLYAFIALPVGLLTGFLRWDPLIGTGRKLLAALTLLIEPGILEELLFRVWLLPHPQEDVSPWRRLVSLVASLSAFELAHPLNGMTLSPRARSLFTDGIFLLQATLLGLACSIAYLVSGSIWPAVFLHWLPVTVWILSLGGAKRVARARWWDS